MDLGLGVQGLGSLLGDLGLKLRIYSAGPPGGTLNLNPY